MKIYAFLLLAMASAHAMENDPDDITAQCDNVFGLLNQKIQKEEDSIFCVGYDKGLGVATLITLATMGAPTMYNAVRHPIRSVKELVEYIKAHPYLFTTKATLYTFLTTMGLSQSARESVGEYLQNKLNLDENWKPQR
jgi:hypothetical protein